MSYSGNKKITVLMIVQSLPPLPAGGAEIQALRLSKKLVERGIEVLFVMPGVGKVRGKTEWEGIPGYALHSLPNYLLDILFFVKKKTKPRISKIEYDDASEKTDAIISPIGMGPRLRYLIFLRNVRAFLRARKNNIDIIHVHTIEWPAYVAALMGREFGKKVVIKDSTMNGIYNILRYPSGKQKQQLLITDGHFVAMSTAIKSNLLSAGVPLSSISTIPNGIDIQVPAKSRTLRNLQKLIFVGNLYQQPAKGIDILLKAWPEVQEKCKNVQLLVAGEGDISAYTEYARGKGIAGTVRFLGKQKDIGSLLDESDLFVLPSRREGMSNALMEAMLREMPCIATDISGNQDLIVNGEHGLLVPPADSHALASAIIYMIQHPDEAYRMGKRAGVAIREKADMNSVAEKYIKLYNNLLSAER
jgi:glycosyltransferase involved in cell wall biosynthesis